MEGQARLSVETWLAASERGYMGFRRKLGELLLDRGEISLEAMEHAVAEQPSAKLLLGELLLERGLVQRGALISALEEITHVPFMDCTKQAPQPEALKLVPRATALRHCALPMCVDGKQLIVIMAEPQNLFAIDDLRFACGISITVRLGFRHEILNAISRCYGEMPRQAESELVLNADPSALQVFSASTKERNEAAIREFEAELRGDSSPAARLMSVILTAAVEKRASDIHIEQSPDDCTVRIRVDGVLQELLRVPGTIRSRLVSRIKILSDMDIAERRVPQDGRFLVRAADCDYDLRVSTLPTQYGEKVVIRLLNSSAASVPFCELGLSADNDRQLTKAIMAPQGMVLVTGPTGSGKSSTLYSALSLLRSPKVNIVTVEDPVEYVVEGVNQVQVNQKAGRTFASCLRSLLRQDPNVIMVGEIRDPETAEIALTAAQTGHMVLSTLHTNDSVSAITRLLDIGSAAFLIASSVKIVMAQRLVRKLCEHCKQMVPATAQYNARLSRFGATRPQEQMAQSVGCPKCDGSGYKGRSGIFEVFTLDDGLRAAIRSGQGDDELRAIARGHGMKLLQEDAVDKVLAGITSIDEVERVIPIASVAPKVCQRCAKPAAPSFLFCPYCGTNVTKLDPGHEAAAALWRREGTSSRFRSTSLRVCR